MHDKEDGHIAGNGGAKQGLKNDSDRVPIGPDEDAPGHIWEAWNLIIFLFIFYFK
jgi:hypothetical protein